VAVVGALANQQRSEQAAHEVEAKVLDERSYRVTLVFPLRNK
jgi:predicted CoA-binding protein